ncbi:hypothetical protein AF335_16440 [Streptomyces eurocidicus]|uniref:G3E family GTPase n=1 Tax=Streptomyces eurocidicus TaxID=66423 RepID=A0A2N8NWB0_STREU|nr:CobW family GTP-binding protein [Streptomyces eurocidicus]MBB5122165.1 G3E family GTPase [Streptomyces eurocidicus]MBF6055563.1 GTP-binding protein [Streptomyces eurocidicus]PNE33060.1 hypothetical protein AF335_16440 [Streptomyces eurocidicus]
MAKRQIPVIVLAGFLGSGKTTLLNHLLSRSGGSRIGVVVNDFGSIEIDAMSVAGQVDSMVSLGNGCLCCAVDTSELDGFLDRLARPAARIDVIVIEASGLAEPQELIRMILASDNTSIVYGGLVEVVDAAEFAGTRARHPEIDRHLALADLVVLNKADRVPEDARRALREELGRIGRPGTPVVEASYGRVDPELLFDRKPREEDTAAIRQLSFEDLVREERERADAREHGHGADGHGDGCTDGCADACGHGAHLHAAYDSVAFTADGPMDPRRLMDFLDNRPDGLYRIKGYVRFGAAGHRRTRYEVHAVGDFLRFYATPAARGEDGPTELVLIGTGIDPEALRSGLEACRHLAEEDAEEHTMWGVLRYAQG